MYFQAAIVKRNHNIGITLCFVGILIALVSGICSNIDSLGNIPWTFMVIGFGIFVTGLFTGAGKTGLYRIDKEIFLIDDEKIQVGVVMYPLSEISNLKFYYDSFNGQSPYGFYTETSGEIDYGIDNSISFTYRKMKCRINFYLQDEAHATAFKACLRELEAREISYKSSYRTLQRN